MLRSRSAIFSVSRICTPQPEAARRCRMQVVPFIEAAF
ncbi:hypothetical protein RISK_001102 [Rhodopirellula islandica]|uniref:Uncharacterized protein n=1 Tax=Rhodopirellula islandica TaxID=595434 RepID=A0A0J1BK35_RHOIS|nr:hypothetical protein RISK_001102 [Rhodopirellula islandica]